MVDVRLAVVIGTILVLFPALAHANDSAAEVAAGGISFLKRTDIVLQKEVLTIGPKKVTVEYEFLNPTAVEVAVKVAFPLPPMAYVPDSSSVGSGSDFSVTVDGRVRKFETMTVARLGDEDVTAELLRAGLPLADFRGWERAASESPALRLSKKSRDQLVARGLLDADEAFPLWTAEVAYVWDQSFPSHRVTKIKHAYTPHAGRGIFAVDGSERNGLVKSFPADCPLPAGALGWITGQKKKGGMIYQQSVAYILRTANNWKTPIGDFSLIVDRGSNGAVVICSDLPVPTASGDTLAVAVKSYVPSRDLIVYFLADHGPAT